MEVDLEKLICSLFKQIDKTGYKLRMSNLIKALKEQGLEYKENAIKPIKKPVNFEEFPRQEQLKWYICIKSIPQKDGGFMPLFCEGEHAPIEKIFDMLPELKNDTTLFTEHFRKVTEVDLPKEKPSTIKFNEPNIDSMVNEFLWTHIDTTISSHTRAMMEEAYRQGLEDMYKRLKSMDKIELLREEIESRLETNCYNDDPREELESLLKCIDSLQKEPKDKCFGCNNVKGCIACVNGSEWAHYYEK